MKRLLIVAALAAAPVLCVAAPAAAEEPEATTAEVVASYTLVAWKIADPANIWGTPQVLVSSVALTEPGLDAFDTSLPCGTYYQIDLYNSGEVTDALIAGGHLDAPNNPAEDLAHGAVAGDPWKYLQTADCVRPDDVVTSGSSEVKDCDAQTITTHTWTETITYTGNASGWTASEPVRVEESSVRPTVVGDCPEALALTGSDMDTPTFAALLVILVGVMLVMWPHVRRAR